MKIFMSILVTLAVSSPLALAENIARGDQPQSNCSHAKKKINMRNANTNPKAPVVDAAKVLGKKKAVQ